MLNVNHKLKRAIGQSMTQIWDREASGLLVRTATITIDAQELEQWVLFIVRGLSFHHWGVVYDEGYNVEFFAPSRPAILRNLLDRPAERSIPVTTIGGGVLTYQALLGKEPLCAAWRVIIFGGLTLGGEDPRVRTSEFGVLVTPKRRPSVAA
jgi:hypothetical protein